MRYPETEEATPPSDIDQQTEETPRTIKKRKQINDAQRQAMRRYAAQWAIRHGKRTPHTHLGEWFEATYGWSIAMSIVSHIMSDKYAYLDTGELARPDAKRSVAPNWPDLEAALWDWQQHYEALHNAKVNGDVLRDQAQQLWTSMDIYKDKPVPEFSSGWITGYKERHGAATKRKAKHGLAFARNATLTEWLTSLDPNAFHRACHEVEFFSLLGQGQVPAVRALSFLIQERFKTLADIKYLGGLLTKLPSSTTSKLHARILNTIVEEISCLQARLQLVDNTLPLYDHLPVKYRPSDPQPILQTLAYTTLFAPSSSTALLPSLALYWAMRKLYYTAFGAANLVATSMRTVTERRRTQSDSSYDRLAQDLDSGILRRQILPHFIAEDVGARVHKLGGLLNSTYEARNPRDSSLIEERTVCGQLWRQALWTFSTAWPTFDPGTRESDSNSEDEVEVSLQIHDRSGYAAPTITPSHVAPRVNKGPRKRGRGRNSAGPSQSTRNQSAYEAEIDEHVFVGQLRVAIA